MTSPFIRTSAAVLAPIVLAAAAAADVRLPGILSDHVVLQREKRVRIFGFAAPDECVRVRASWGATSEDAFADQDGQWSTTLVTPAAGGPFTLEVRGKNVVTVSDVMVGEVWLCAGQSNMEMPLAARESGFAGVLDWPREVADARHPEMRIFDVAKAVAAAPRDDTHGHWQVVTPDTIPSFSATAYFFGRKLQEELGVPVGLVASDYGGTPAESWTSGITLKTFPEFADEVERLEREARAPARAAAERTRRLESWLGVVEEVDHGIRDGRATATFDDSSWPSTEVPGPLAGGLEKRDGVFWMRRAFTLPDSATNRDVVVELGPVDDFDVTFVDGVRVGSALDPTASSLPRVYPLPKTCAAPGRHVIAVRIVDVGGDAGILGRASATRVRCGNESIPLAGAWRVHAGPPLTAINRRPGGLDLVTNTPSSLYNAMIAPLARFSFRGVIWYQGESNRPRAAQYRRLFPALIADWRARFSAPDMPFYYVQIAPYAYGGDVGEAFELREAQRLALEVPDTGMVVTSDIGDEHDIHPRNKQEVGRRLALWALARTYGRTVEYSGPILRRTTIARDPATGQDVARLEFDHADGLRLVPDARTPIEVEIAPGVWEMADARIDGHVASLTHAGGRILAVRSGASAIAGPALENDAGLPASSFRSDDVAWITDRVHVEARWKRAGDILTLAAPIASADEGVPLGNGRMGAVLSGGGHEIAIALDRSDAWDLRRPANQERPDWNWKHLSELVHAGDAAAIRDLFDAPCADAPFPTKLALPRLVLPIESTELASFGLDLAQTEARVTLGHGLVRAFVSSAEPVMMLRVDGVEPGAGLRFDCGEFAARGVEARTANGKESVTATLVGPSGFSYALAAVSHPSAGGIEIAVAIVDGAESSDPLELALRRCASALETGYGPLLGQHVSTVQIVAGPARVVLPDPNLQTQYDLARTLMVAGSRRGSPPMPMQGLWTSAVGPAHAKGEYRNVLNVPAAYQACATAGAFDSELALFDFDWKLLPRMREFARDFFGVEGAVVPGTMALDGTPLGGPTPFALSPASGAWTAELFARHWRVTGDDEFLERRAWPWCREIGDALRALAPPGASRRRKLALSSSPEFGAGTPRAWLAPDSNHDLALMRSVFVNLAAMAHALGRAEEAGNWTQALSELDDFDLDARGALTIAPGVPYASSQRVQGHAFAIYPLGELTIEGTPRERRIVDATLDEILEQGTSAWNGSSFAWMACLAARAGRPETALRCLREFERGFTLRNGLHCNGDQSGEALASDRSRAFTIEGNLIALEAVHEMLLQSWAGVVRVFPCTSSGWPDVSFESLCAEGGFVVTAHRAGGLTQDVSIRAIHAATLRLRDPFPGANPAWNRTDIRRDGTDWVVSLQRDDELVGTRAGAR